MLLSGEAGIGKTAIVEELVSRAGQLVDFLFLGKAEMDSHRPFQIISNAFTDHIDGPIFEEGEQKGFSTIFAVEHGGQLLGQAVQDEGLESGTIADMLSAVQSFVRDSFDPGQESSLPSRQSVLFFAMSTSCRPSTLAAFQPVHKRPSVNAASDLPSAVDHEVGKPSRPLLLFRNQTP